MGRAVLLRRPNQIVAPCAESVTTNTKPDKGDSYLSYNFLRGADGDEPFMINLLLEDDHARRYDKLALEQWEED